MIEEENKEEELRILRHHRRFLSRLSKVTTEKRNKFLSLKLSLLCLSRYSCSLSLLCCALQKQQKQTLFTKKSKRVCNKDVSVSVSSRSDEVEVRAFPLAFFPLFFFVFCKFSPFFLLLLLKSTVNHTHNDERFSTNGLSLFSGQQKRKHTEENDVTSVQNNNDDGSCGTVVFAKSACDHVVFGDGRSFVFFFALVCLL